MASKTWRIDVPAINNANAKTKRIHTDIRLYTAAAFPTSLTGLAAGTGTSWVWLTCASGLLAAACRDGPSVDEGSGDFKFSAAAVGAGSSLVHLTGPAWGLAEAKYRVLACVDLSDAV
jgi:hypothetical protein